MPTKQAQDPFKKIQEEKEQELREAQARAQREADERDKRTIMSFSLQHAFGLCTHVIVAFILCGEYLVMMQTSLL